MSRVNVPLISFNRGLISDHGLARVDLARTSMSAEIQNNFMCRVLGSMSLRTGMQYIVNTYNNKKSFSIPFVKSTIDVAGIELTDQNMRVLVNDAIIQRQAVDTVIDEPSFNNIGTWADTSGSGGSSSVSGGQLLLTGTGVISGAVEQEITISVGDQPTQHGLRIDIARGSIDVSIGTTSGDGDIRTATLSRGIHSFTFTPNAGSVFITLSSVSSSKALINSCDIEVGGDMVIPAPWVEADLSLIRYDQSADVIYLACEGYSTKKIERRNDDTWSLVDYFPQDGSFKVINTSTISLTPSSLTGEITLTASRSLFNSLHVGALFKLGSVGQSVDSDLTGADQFSEYVRVTGVASTRHVKIITTGTWVGTLTLQRSIDEAGTWVDVDTYTINKNYTYDDNLDNQIAYYRIGFKSGNYTSGAVNISLEYSSGSIDGIVEITAYQSKLLVDATVLKPLGGLDPTSNWYEGEWSDYRGHPTALALDGGRLWLAGKNKIIGSVSDGYESFDTDVEGDSGTISKTIGRGAVDVVNWVGSIKRLIFGTDGSEWVAKSSSLDEPLTPTNIHLKDPSTEGSAKVQGVKIGNKWIFVQRSGTRIFQIDDAGDQVYGDLGSSELTELVPEVGEPSITRLAVQRQPDTRIHALRSDGTVAVLVSEPLEDVLAWITLDTDGIIEDIWTLPAQGEDDVYYQVKRTINGVDVRFHERFAEEKDCIGGLLNKQADAHVIYDGVPTTTITGLDHLEGEEVIVWADGKDKGTNTVISGIVTMQEAVSKAVVGLTYKARFKSTKLAYGAQLGTALTKEKKIHSLGLVLKNTHHNGIKYGSDFDNLQPLPSEENGRLVTPDTVHEHYDQEQFEFDGTWTSDSRLCLEAEAPRPCTVLGAIVGISTNG